MRVDGGKTVRLPVCVSRSPTRPSAPIRTTSWYGESAFGVIV